VKQSVVTSGALWLVWLCVGLLALTWMACSSEPRQPQNPATPARVAEEIRGEPCAHDGDCASQFCDRGVCAEPGTKGNYGEPCEPPAPIVLTPPPRPDMPSTWYRSRWSENKCGGYLCVDKRCRSCQSDAECNHQSTGMTCSSRGDWPGKGCGDYSHAEPTEPAAPPPPPPSELPPE